jgi:DNA-binding NarL/FixJ family response regulator
MKHGFDANVTDCAAMMSIRVAIVEDNASMRVNLAEFIHGTPGYSCVSACASAEEALRLVPSSAADVALVDINLPGRSGLELVRELRQINPRLQIIMLTVEADQKRIFEALKAGATGYLVKHVHPEEILEAIREVQTGGAPMSSQVARMVVSAFREPAPEKAPELQLSAREAEILRLLACGDRSKEIAEKLGIGVGTVNTHIRHVYEKLHVRSRAEAVARFLKK